MSALTRNHLLVELNMSVWTGMKQDVQITDEVLQQKNAENKKAGKFTKNLLAGSAKLKAVQSTASNARLWFYKSTLSWGDSGQRLLPYQQLFEFRQKLGEHREEFQKAVDEFLVEYPTVVETAAQALGDMFDLSEYPTPKQAAKKFSFGFVFTPVPEVGDFRVSAAEEELASLRNEYDAVLNERMNIAMKEVWQRLYDVCKHMSDRLTPDADGKRKIIRDSMIEHANELLECLSGMNIMNDPNLKQAEKDLSNAIFAVDGNELRKNEVVREAVKNRVDELLGKFGDWGVAPLE